MKGDTKTHVSSVPVKPILFNALKGHSLEKKIKEYIKKSLLPQANHGPFANSFAAFRGT